MRNNAEYNDTQVTMRIFQSNVASWPQIQRHIRYRTSGVRCNSDVLLYDG